MVLAGDGDLVVGFLEFEESYDALLHELSRDWAGDQVGELLLRDSKVLPDLDDAQRVRAALGLYRQDVVRAVLV